MVGGGLLQSRSFSSEVRTVVSFFFFGKSGAKNEKAQAAETSVARVKQQEAVRRDFKQCKSLGSQPLFSEKKELWV